MPRVFIPQEPMRRSPTGALVSFLDLAKAEQYGELVRILPPGRDSLNPETSLPILREKLRDFSPEDYLLPIGAPILTAWTAIIAATAHDEPIQILLWDEKYGRYDIVTASPI